MKILVLIIFSFFSFANQVELLTTPKAAEIFVQVNPQDQPISLGKTPLIIPVNDLANSIGESQTYILTMKKKGHEDYRIMMIKNKKAKVKLDVVLDVEKTIENVKKHDNLVSKLFKIQGLIRSNNFSDAITKLTGLEKDYQDFSVVSELKGIAYYMNRDMDNALSMFRTAFAKNSENRDAYKMKKYLEKKLGLDVQRK